MLSISQRGSSSCFQSIILTTTVVCIKKLFEPLKKLKIILKLLSGQFVNIYCLQNIYFLIMIHKFKNLKVKEFSVTKATLESQMSICLSLFCLSVCPSSVCLSVDPSEIKTHQSLEIISYLLESQLISAMMLC